MRFPRNFDEKEREMQSAKAPISGTLVAGSSISDENMDRTSEVEKGDDMKRKVLWLPGLVIAGLLAVSPPANAGGWAGLR